MKRSLLNPKSKIQNLKFVALGLVCWAALANAQTVSDCLDCHSDSGLTREKGGSVAVNPEVFKKSVHGQAGLACVDCHQDLKGVKAYPHPVPLKPVECATCHESENAAYQTSIHGQSLAKTPKGDAATCSSCHGTHDILPPKDPDSKTFRLNIPATCGHCHLNPEIAGKNASGSVAKVESYFTSIHGWALAKAGLVNAAVCTDCHGSHDIHRPTDPKSKVARALIPKTCSQCHLGVYQTYLSSIHGEKFASGNPDVPVCTNCHNEHRIQLPSDPNSSVNPAHVSRTCSACHENKALNLKYSLPTGRLKSYQSSYHGISNKLGDLTVANCASCHGYHDVLPSSDPRSTTNPANLSKTCGKCHPQGDHPWDIGKIHASKRMEEHWIPRLVQRIYLLLIAATLMGLLAFIATDLYSRLRVHRAGKKATSGADRPYPISRGDKKDKR